MNCFDHHQDGCSKHFNEKFESTLSASSGMVWKYFGFDLSNHDGQLWEGVYRSLIEEIDRQDNGQDPIGRGPLFQVNPFNPSWNDDSNGDAEFETAVEIASQFLAAAIKREKALIASQTLHETTLENQTIENVFVMDEYYPWPSYLVGQEHPFTFAIYPRKTGDWAIQSIPIGTEGFENKGSLPVSWLHDECRPVGMIFCHKALFIASFETKEQAIKMAKKAIFLL